MKKRHILKSPKDHGNVLLTSYRDHLLFPYSIRYIPLKANYSANSRL